MSFFPCPDPVLGDKTSVDSIETLVIPRTSDIGGWKCDEPCRRCVDAWSGRSFSSIAWDRLFCGMEMHWMCVRIRISVFPR